MRKLLRVPTLLFIIIVTSIVFNLGMMGVFLFVNITQDEYIHVRTYSDNLTFIDGEYYIEEEIKSEIEERNLFAFIIAPDGNVVWEYNKPVDIEDYFTLNEVASISRWYLNGYPVSVWARDDGLLVLGALESNQWKYNITMEITQLEMLLWLLPLTLVLDFVIVFFICYKMTKKWQKERDLARTEWVATVSHDIRTPLSMVLGYSESLKSNTKLTDEEREKLGIIAHQSELIKKSLEDINLVNRLDYAEEVKMNEPFSVSKTIREVVADKLNGGIDDIFVFDLDLEENLIIRGDVNLFKRMIDNIISNCIKHNSSGTNIHIKAEKKNRKYQIEIADTGKGFANVEAMNKKIDKEFLFADDNHSLGLVIIKKIASRFHGKVIFSNEEGATVTLVF